MLTPEAHWVSVADKLLPERRATERTREPRKGGPTKGETKTGQPVIERERKYEMHRPHASVELQTKASIAIDVRPGQRAF